MSARMTQSAQLLSYLRSGERLTPLKSLDLFGCLALSQRMGELSRAGHPIAVRMIRLPNGKRVAEYHLIEANDVTA